MWSDPSLQLDLHFLELVPCLDECSACEYPVEGKQLLQLANAAAASFNIPALIGATTLPQLRANLASATLTLSEDVLSGIEAIHAGDPNPAP